ncbi:MAG: ParD-like family protein [Pseudomonadota bacterium]
MSTAVKLSEDLIEMAKRHAAAEHRSVAKQIEHWARLGKAVEDNPGLPVQFIKDTLLAAQEKKSGMLAPYQFGN